MTSLILKCNTAMICFGNGSCDVAGNSLSMAFDIIDGAIRSRDPAIFPMIAHLCLQFKSSNLLEISQSMLRFASALIRCVEGNESVCNCICDLFESSPRMLDEEVADRCTAVSRDSYGKGFSKLYKAITLLRSTDSAFSEWKWQVSFPIDEM